MLLDDIAHEFECPLDFAGPLELLAHPRCALLVSRTDRVVTPASPVLQLVIDSAAQIAARGDVLVCGTDRDIWDTALLTCRDANGAAVIVLEEKCSDELRTFIPTQSLLIWPRNPIPKRRKTDRLMLRDRLVGRLATCALGVQLRPGGNMSAVAEALRKRNCIVETRSCVLERPRSTPSAPLLMGANHSPSLAAIPLLTHFTRAPNGAWPGEPRVDYLRWLCSGMYAEPRDDFSALCRILSERRIRACGRLIPGGVAMCCFSAADPRALVAQRFWRKGLRRWNISPFAIAFNRDTLKACGARPVHYYNSLKEIETAERCFTQPSSSSVADWKTECEWRLRGDLNFSDMENVTAFVPDSAHAQSLRELFAVNVQILS